MKNIISIDLTKFNKEKLVDVANLYKLDPDALVNNKANGFHTLYVDTTSGKVIAFTTKKNKEIVYTSVFTEALKSIEPVVMIKEPKEMTVDTILDKISKYGVASLTVNEKKFLDENYK